MSEILTFLANAKPLLLLLVGFLIGRYLEAQHYRSIVAREKELQSLPAISSREMPPIPRAHTMLVSGCSVVSVDYFKQFLAGLRKIFGGRISAYETLIDRARRESVLRMKESAQQLGAKLILNVKIETSSMFKESGRIFSVEVVAYGTALILPERRTDGV